MQKYYTELEQFVIYLDYIGLSKKKIIELIKTTTSVNSFIERSKTDVQIGLLLGEYKNTILGQDLISNIQKVIEYLALKQIGATTFISSDYPISLKEIEPMPVVIYYKGDLSLLSNKLLLGIVGTRKPTRYGRSITENFTKVLSKEGVITVSGLAYGIDSEVARNTLQVKGKTVAVLGGGLNAIYPSSNASLATEIVEKGGIVLSEYFPSVRPTKYSFPERNRIISGLSNGVLVIEAGLKSGSLITAMHAIEQNKELFVVPGNIDSKESAGSNKLIEELPHAFTINPEYILEHFGLKKQEKESVSHQYTLEESRVVEALCGDSKSFDELCEILKEDSKTLNLLLTEMEISGIIKKLPGNYYGT